jgi:hypothetical protein
MERFTSALGALIAVGLLAVGAWAVVKGVEKDPAVVAAIVTAGGAVAGVAVQRRWEKRRELERLHRDEMAPLYEQLVENPKEAPEHEAGVAFYKRFSTKIIVHGPTPVVETWLHWTRSFVEDDPLNLIRWEQVLRAIRADLGHDDSKLQPGDLLTLYITDVDDLIATLRGQRIAAEVLKAQAARPGCGPVLAALRRSRDGPGR